MKVMTNPKRCCVGISCRKDLVLIEEENKNENPINDLVLSINGVVFSRYAQIIVLPRDIDTIQKSKHRRNINLPVSCEHRKNMIIKHIMNIKVRSKKVIGVIYHVLKNVHNRNKTVSKYLERHYQSKQACILDGALQF